VTGLNIAFQAFAAPGEGIIAQPPVYFHFLRDPEQHGRVLQQVPLARSGNRYEIDFDLLERSITKETRLFALCNPHNPVGRVFARDELEKIAEVCLRKRLIICSDEIHCDLIYPPHKHIPIASLSPEVEERTVTLMAPSKTYNIAGLDCGYAIIKSKELRNKWMDFSSGLIPHINIMGHVAALAALLHGQDWLGQVLKYLEGNRDFIEAYLREEIPNITMNKVEGTYLGWLNCEKAGMIRNSAEVMSNPAEFFRAKAGVALSDGIEFGKDGENFVRLNFACSRKTLATALNRMRAALEIL
jgi:cystathionine beta-lyase